MTQQDHVVNVATRSAAMVGISDEEYSARQVAASNAERAAQISVQKSAFCIQFRTVYAAEGSPAGALTGTADAFISALLAALASGDGEALTDAQKTEAMERWATASKIERANSLIDLLAPVLFGDSDALSAADDAVVLAELARVSGVADQLFIDAEAL